MWSGPRSPDLRRLSAGASRETWSFDAGGRGLVLRRDPPGSPRPAEMAREAECLRAAAAAGVPVPAVVAAGDGSADGGDGIGTPYLVMERVEGETLPPRLLRDDRWAPLRRRLPREFGRALARIHGIDPAVVPSCSHVDDRLAVLRAQHDAFGEPRPALEVAFRWLAAHRPAPVAPAVVHGDFRNGNVLIGDDGLRAVLDWELVHVGDPREDLGWVCTRAWRFGRRGAVGGFGERDELLDGYAEVAGHRPDPAEVHWWEVFGSVHWAVICRMQTERHLSGAERSLEMAVLGRRAVESEYDALLALGLVAPGAVDADAPAPDDGPDRPTPDELLDALSGFLTDELTTPTTRGAATSPGSRAPASASCAGSGRPGRGTGRNTAAGSPASAARTTPRSPPGSGTARSIRTTTPSPMWCARALLARLAVANPRYAEEKED